MKKQQKCYIYTRVSTSMQVDGYSFDAQKDKLRKYAEYQEMSTSGNILMRVNLAKVWKADHSLSRCLRM